MQQIRDYQEYVNKGGTNHQKFSRISRNTFNKFKNSRENYLPVHDLDLKRWALKFAREEGLPTQVFSASDYWIKSFKKKYRISSRKITKFMSKAQFVNKEEIENNALEFILQTKDYLNQKRENGIRKFHRSLIVNSDQSSFSYEMFIPRSLSHVGERKTFCLHQNANAITHSYTIMPILRSNGHFLPKCMIILQKSDELFGPQIQKK